MIKFFRWILLPFSLIYQCIIIVRNLLYDYQLLKSKSYRTPTIVIGNLAIGGTGKSPMTEYLLTLLKDQYRIATLSRGYGRKTKGFKFVETTSTAIEVGDEPLQFKNKFPDITVAVCEDRCAGMDVLQHEHDVVILDDAYQHRKLKPGYSILLFDYQSLFKPLLTLPTGDFRDDIRASKRADIIVITKCPETISETDKMHIEQRIRPYNSCPIFYSHIVYSTPKDLNGFTQDIELQNKEIVLFCGIANPTPLVKYLESKNNRVQLIQFPDHHNYTQADFQHVLDKYHSLSATEKLIITTEKDKQRIDSASFESVPFYYIPIQIEFADQQQHTLNHFILNYIQKNVNEA